MKKVKELSFFSSRDPRKAAESSKRRAEEELRFRLAEVESLNENNAKLQEEVGSG